jgi:hypothetical protein
MKANEELAAYAHDAWTGWMKYLFEQSQRNADGSVTIPSNLVARWERQMTTPYAELPEAEKESDRIEACKIMRVFLGPPDSV